MNHLEYSLVVFSFAQFAFSGSIPPPPYTESVEIRKCCGDSMYFEHPKQCKRDENGTLPWKPEFIDPERKESVVIPKYRVKFGIPSCHAREPWKILNYTKSCDKLILLPDGRLRHYVVDEHEESGSYQCKDEIDEENSLYQDYNVSDYCIDQMRDENGAVQIAMICLPYKKIPWHDTNFVMRRIINPAFHIVSIVCLLLVAVIYVVLPQLCDLVGNIVTTLAVCLIFVQISDLIRIFDEYHSKMSYFVSDAIMYVSSLGAFFWLNSLGYYIWKTFRSRNVFLRVTDGRKYCCYSLYAWTGTFCMGAMALFAHVVLNVEDANSIPKQRKSVTEAAIAELGVAVVLTTIASTISVNIFFCLSTAQVINRISTYGRIHHKLKHSFQIFTKLFIVITTNWFFIILSWFPIDGLFYLHIFANLFQSLAFLYIAVLGVRKIRFLLSKACCHEKCICPCCRPGDPGEISDWGEEMMAMNIGSY